MKKDEGRSMKSMSRRAFVASMAAGVGAVALSGCTAGGSAPQAAPNASGEAEQTTAGNEGEPGSASGGNAASTASADASKVYMTEDISPAGLAAAFAALGVSPKGNVAVKLSTGEPGSNYLRPELVGDFVRSLDGTIVECNTAYGGQRGSTERHREVAASHGFTAVADVDIMDAEGEMSIPVVGGSNLSEDLVGSHLGNYDSIVTLSHFKGHAMGGFGGAIKNNSIGIASSSGKLWIHSAGTSKTSWGGGTQDAFLESMAEAAKAVSDFMGPENVAYVNVMNGLSVDCDCDGNLAEPTMADVGILASTDPVALDRACVDLVYAAPDGADVIERIESRNGAHTLDHAEAIGLGSQTYELIRID